MSPSVAAFVTVKVTNSFTVWLVCVGSAGPLWMGVTVTTKLLVAVSAFALTAPGSVLVTTVVKVLVLGTWPTVGVQWMMPLVSIVVIVFVLGPWFFAGVHVITPFVELIVAPVGGLRREYARLYAGMSPSVAALVTVKVTNSFTVWLVCVGSAGPLWMGVTVTTKLLVAVSAFALTAPGSVLVTTVVNVLVLGTWPTVGVQWMIPLVSIVAPTGAACRP